MKYDENLRVRATTLEERNEMPDEAITYARLFATGIAKGRHG